MNPELTDLKREVYQQCVQQVSERIAGLKKSLQDYQEAANEETKSSAGDKYETGRAMMHLEKEKVALSLDEALKQKKVLDLIKPEKTSGAVGMGCLVKTDRGLFFLAAGLGKVRIGDYEVFCISPVAPIGKVMSGRTQGDQCEFNKIIYRILDIA